MINEPIIYYFSNKPNIFKQDNIYLDISNNKNIL